VRAGLNADTRIGAPAHFFARDVHLALGLGAPRLAGIDRAGDVLADDLGVVVNDLRKIRGA